MDRVEKTKGNTVTGAEKCGRREHECNWEKDQTDHEATESQDRITLASIVCSCPEEMRLSMRMPDYFQNLLGTSNEYRS